MPFINIVSNAKIKKEKEYLLPRNIIFELISKNGNEYTVLAKPYKPDQFTIKTGCFELDLYDITPVSLQLPAKISLSSPKKSKARAKSNIDSGKSKIIPVKSTLCIINSSKHF